MQPTLIANTSKRKSLSELENGKHSLILFFLKIGMYFTSLHQETFKEQKRKYGHLKPISCHDIQSIKCSISDIFTALKKQDQVQDTRLIALNRQRIK